MLDQLLDHLVGAQQKRCPGARSKPRALLTRNAE
jgi:hypothetical protein